MIVVTGGCGFIGSNLVRSLVDEGRAVVVVDDADPAPNLDGVALAGHLDQEAFRRRLVGGGRPLEGVEAVLHQGACSDTTERDEAFLTRNNVAYSVTVLDACLAAKVPLIYASSAAVYGLGPRFVEEPGAVAPLNGYARSKAAFDAHVEALGPLASPVVGLRYFNVYGPHEGRKGPMASQALQLWQQVRDHGEARVFGAGEGCGPGEHARDFVHVDDVVAVVRWFLDHPEVSGTFNCGTGESRTFGELASLVVAAMGRGRVAFVDFPDELRGRYQAHTQADLTKLRAAGCDHRFATLEEGVARYVRWLESEPGALRPS